MADKEYYVRNFEDWACARFGDFQQVERKSDTERFFHKYVGNKVFLVDTKKNKMAMAKCRPDEQFSYVIGLGVAYARLTGQPIPKERQYVMLETLKTGQHFTTSSGEEFVFIGTSPKYNQAMIICESVKGSTLRYFHKSVFVTLKK